MLKNHEQSLPDSTQHCLLVWRQGKDRFLQNEDKVTSVAMACGLFFFFYGSRESPKIEPEHIFMLVKYIITLLSHIIHRCWFHSCVFNMFACIWGRCPIFTHKLRSTRRGNPLRILGFWGLQKKMTFQGCKRALGNDTHTYIYNIIKHDMFCWFLMLCFELVLFWSMSEKVTYTSYTIRWSTSIHHQQKSWSIPIP